MSGLAERWKARFGTDSMLWKIVFALGAIGLILFFLGLQLPGLGHLLFWNDEAYTAVFALNIIDTGLPLVRYGPNEFDSFDANRFGVEAKHGWLPYYLCAFFFRLFGVSEFSGRLPFVLLGAVNVLLVVGVGRKLYGRFAGLAAGMLLAAHPVFIKHVHQCRYYSPAMLFAAAVVGLYALNIDKAQEKKPYLQAAAVFLLFMSSQMFAPIILGAVLIHDLFLRIANKVFRSDKESLKWSYKQWSAKWGRTIAATVLLIAPWLLFFFEGLRFAGTHSSAVHLSSWLKQLGTSLTIAHSYYPVVFLLGLLPLKRKEVPYDIPATALISLTLISFLPSEVFYGYGKIGDRYLLYMLPLGALVAARGLSLLFRPKILVGTAAVLLALPVFGIGSSFLKQSYETAFSWKKDFMAVRSLYRCDLPPDPGRPVIEAVKELSKPVKTIYFSSQDPVILMYYLGPEKTITFLDPMKDGLPRPYMILGRPDCEIKPTWIEGCGYHQLAGAAVRDLNQAETYGTSWIDPAVAGYSTDIWVCAEKTD